jgi:hypothetical protein
MMALDQRCIQGHFFDSAQHTSCPHCGIPDLHMQPTEPKRATVPEHAGGSSDPTIRARPESPSGNVGGGATVGHGQGGERGAEPGKTIGIFRRKLGIDPVVGWLVCIEGPERGRDYRIRSGRNFIGREPSMHIPIKEDKSISRDKHAVLSYEPKHGRFRLAPGDGSGLTYLNDEMVDTSVELKPFDTIELGETRLKFVPFCGEEFRWSTESEGQES